MNQATHYSIYSLESFAMPVPSLANFPQIFFLVHLWPPCSRTLRWQSHPRKQHVVTKCWENLTHSPCLSPHLTVKIHPIKCGSVWNWQTNGEGGPTQRALRRGQPGESRQGGGRQLGRRSSRGSPEQVGENTPSGASHVNLCTWREAGYTRKKQDHKFKRTRDQVTTGWHTMSWQGMVDCSGFKSPPADCMRTQSRWDVEGSTPKGPAATDGNSQAIPRAMTAMTRHTDLLHPPPQFFWKGQWGNAKKIEVSSNLNMPERKTVIHLAGSSA